MISNHPAAVNETRLRVRYAETDQMGVVYHSNHFIWFEVGRVELLRQLGFSYRDMESEDGRFIAVAEAKCRYRAPARCWPQAPRMRRPCARRSPARPVPRNVHCRC